MMNNSEKLTNTNYYINGWYAILPSKELRKNSRPLSINRFDLPLVIWRKKDDSIAVLLDKCPHRGAQLSLGKITDDAIQCPFHGYQFEAKGSCIMAPEFCKSIPKMRATVYPVHEALDMIWMYWGEGPETPFDYRELEHIHQTFGGQYSATKKTWSSHITYCIENQLDYTHLRFVHHNTIGRGFQMPENPTEICDENKISIYLNDKNKASMIYYFPNSWVLNISDRMKLMLFFSPIGRHKTQLYLRTYRSFMNYPIIKILFDKIMTVSNRVVLRQDQQVVASQGELPSYLAKNDMLMRHDKAIRYFREQWKILIEK